MPALHDIVTKGSVDRSVVVHIMDSTDGTPETGVVFNTSGIDLWYRREGAVRVAITEVTLAALTTAHTDGGFLHVSDGDYRVDLPDAAYATGANYVDFGGTVTGMIVVGGRVRLVDYSLEDAVRGTVGTALPNAVAGASGGVLISGTNAGTTTLGALTITGATTHTGATVHTAAVTMANGLVITNATSNGHGISATGNGTGSGFLGTGGATGHGLRVIGGSTSGNGIRASGTAGNSEAVNLSGQGSAAGMVSSGGATGAGLSLVGGATSGDALLTATTSGHGIVAAGTGTTKHGISATGGATSSHGISATGGGSGSGLNATGGATGHGINGVGGSTSGNGIRAAGTAGNSVGLNAIGQGSAAGVLATGGATGQGMSLVGGSTSGLGLGIDYTAPVGGAKQLGLLDTGTMQSGSTSTTAVLAASTTLADDIPDGVSIAIVAGTGAGQNRSISDWDNATDTATVAPAWVATPDNTSQYELYRTAPIAGGAGGGDATEAKQDIIIATLGSAGAGLTSIPWNASWDAQVESECTDALNAYDPPTNAEMTARTLASASYATPTNITAGTITNVTNLTNAPTAGDFTSTMKTSIGTAVAASAVASVTGSVGSIASGGITATSIASDAFTAAKFASDVTTELQSGLATASNLAAVKSDTAAILLDTGTDGVVVAAASKTGYALSSAGVDSIWDEPQSGHVTAGTFGVYLDSSVSGVSTGGISAGEIAEAVWDEALAGHVGAGSAGAALTAAAAGGGDATEAKQDIIIATLGSAGAGLTNIPWNASWDAQVESEVTDALNAYDPPTNAEMVARTLASASYATPTNITAGTITTVTNLTNAPTSGDLTATMKTSIGTAVAASAVASVTAGVSVGSGGITAASFATSAKSLLGSTANGTLSGTHTDTTADLGTSAPTTDIVGQTVYFPDHKLSRIISAYNTGTGVATFESIGVTLANSNEWYLYATGIGSSEAGNATEEKQDEILAAIAAGVPLSSAAVDSILDEVVEGTTTLRQSVRLANSALGGKASGLATNTAVYRDLADSKNRITATVDEDGNRSSVTRDLS